MRTVAFCEIEPYCRAVLAKHWLGVPIYPDVRDLTAERLWADGIAVDVICGGFPCQDISVAGKGAGIEGERSGLWSEYARIVGELRPSYVIVENVAALLGRGLGRVLRDLAALGYDAEWHCIPASAVGAPHRRDRFWAVAYPGRERSPGWRGTGDSACAARAPENDSEEREWGWDAANDSREAMADASWDVRSEQAARGAERQRVGSSGQPILSTDADSARLSPSWPQPIGTYWRNARGVFAASDWWSVEPDVGRVAHGISARVDRLRSLGNAVVPQIVEIIGHAILESQRKEK